MRGVVSVVELAEVRKKALRRRAWFRVLSKAERAIVSLTIRCVERVRSPKLAGMLEVIVCKLREAMKGKVERLKETVGRQLAHWLSRFAEAWGNVSARQWRSDLCFIQFLVVMHMNTPGMFLT